MKSLGLTYAVLALGCSAAAANVVDHPERQTQAAATEACIAPGVQHVSVVIAAPVEIGVDSVRCTRLLDTTVIELPRHAQKA